MNNKRMLIKEKKLMLTLGFLLLFLVGCEPEISIDNEGVLSSHEKKLLVKLVKKAQRYYSSRGFFLKFDEIIIELRNSSGFFFHNYMFLEEGKPRIILNKPDMDGPNGDVIVAHEIFHVFQKSYFDFPNRREYAWLTEGTAIAMAVEFAGKRDVLEMYSYDREKSVQENDDASCWFWCYCLEKDKDFILNFFREIEKENFVETRDIYSLLKKFFREMFQTELDFEF